MILVSKDRVLLTSRSYRSLSMNLKARVVWLSKTFSFIFGVLVLELGRPVEGSIDAGSAETPFPSSQGPLP